MRGFSNWWNTKQDVLVSLEMFPVETKEKLQSIYDSKDQWLLVKKLEENEEGIEDDSHKVISVTNDEDVVVERYQYEFKEDPNGTIFRLGFASSAEVGVLLNG